MSLTNADRQVISLYENSGATPEEIAEILNYEVTAVKILLYAKCAEYRNKVDLAMCSQNVGVNAGTPSEENCFTPDEVINAKRTMADLVVTTAEAKPEVAYKAAKFIINESAGRNDLKYLKNAKTTNIIIINQRAANARAALDRARANRQIIDLPSEEPKQIAHAS